MRNGNAVATLEESVKTESVVAKPPAAKAGKFAKALLKIFLIGSVSFVLLLFGAHLAWVFSGSNQWKYMGEENGVKIYTLKAPGADLIQAKGVFRVHGTLAGIVKFMRDPASCEDVGCYESRTIERVDNQLEYGYFRMKYPAPFQPRDFAVRSQVYQSPVTKEVLLEFAAAPGKAPLDDCCVRVTDMNNTWRLIPLGNGEIEIEYIMNMNEGGMIPDVLLNVAHAKVMANLGALQALFNKDKFQNVKLDYITEK